MRVLFLKGLSAWALGGDRTETIRLVRGAADHGSDVALAADALPKELAGLPHFKVDYPQTPAVESQVAAALDAFRPDVVHVIGAGVRFLEAFDRALRRGAAPWIFTCHNVPPAEKIFPRFFGRPRLHYAVRNLLALPSVRLWTRFLSRGSFARVVCHSDTVARRVAARGCDPGKIVTIPFGCDAPVLDPATPSPFPAGASPRILTVAGVAPHKGQLDAVRAMERLKPAFPNLFYCMIGNPRPDDRFARFILRETLTRGLHVNTLLIGGAPEPMKHAALRDADLYLQPSREEGFCIAFMEAAVVVPRVVGTDTGAMRAIAEGQRTMRVVRPGDVDALVGATRDLLKQTVTLEDVERRREELAQRYSWSSYVEQHRDVYEQSAARAVPVSRSASGAAK
jgi:glycosyltransferase involved in cell wall biosynthesis